MRASEHELLAELGERLGRDPDETFVRPGPLEERFFPSDTRTWEPFSFATLHQVAEWLRVEARPVRREFLAGVICRGLVDHGAKRDDAEGERVFLADLSDLLLVETNRAVLLPVLGAAASGLRRLRGSVAIETIRAIALDPGREHIVRGCAITILCKEGVKGDSASLEEVFTLARDPDRRVRDIVVDTLPGFAAWDETTQEVRRRIASVASEWLADAPSAEAVRRVDWIVVAFAGDLVRDRALTSERLLHGTLHDRAGAIWAIDWGPFQGEFRPGEPEAILRLAEGPEPAWARKVAIEALERVGLESPLANAALDAADRLATNDPEPELRKAAGLVVSSLRASRVR